jgi:hypothetical protein
MPCLIYQCGDIRQSINSGIENIVLRYRFLEMLTGRKVLQLKLLQAFLVDLAQKVTTYLP